MSDEETHPRAHARGGGPTQRRSPEIGAPSGPRARHGDAPHEARGVERQTSDLPLGSACEASAECLDGLKCLTGFGEEATCAAQQTCSVRCTEDADCADLGARAVCHTGCGGKKLCVRDGSE